MPWTARPIAAAAVRCAAFVTPFALAAAAAWTIGRLLPTPMSWIGAAGRFLVVVAATVIVLVAARRMLRRLGPLSALLRLSAAFTHDAPNRFRLALRLPSAQHLERALAGTGDDPSLVALLDGDVAARIVALTAAIGAHHPPTRGHSERVRAYADLIGQELGLDPTEREKLAWAGLLHDVGKLTVPGRILDKPDRPDAREWRILAGHPAASAILAESLHDWLGPWAGGIAEHHERWDGSGYPDRLRGEEISLAGRIVAVADSFETMTEIRSYKRSMSFAAAQHELVESAGTHFDSAIVRAFLGISTQRLRRVAGWAAWVPAPVVELGRLGAATWGSASGPAGVAATAAAMLVTPGLTGEVWQRPDTGDGRIVIAAGTPPTEPAVEQRALVPASTFVVTVPDHLGSAPTTTPVVPTAPPVLHRSSPSSSSSSPSSSPVVATVATSAAPRPAPTEATSAGTSEPVAPTATRPAATATTATATTATATTATAATPTGGRPAADPPRGPPRWVGQPTFSAAGQTIVASGVDVDGRGLATTCVLSLLDVPGFVPVAAPCADLMSVLAPERATTYRVQLVARSAAGGGEPLVATVTTDP